MVVSMTGYGRATGQVDSISMTVEMKSVNHRFLDIAMKMPKQLIVYEDKMKKLINRFIRRGRVEVYINFEGDTFLDKSIQVDWDLVSEYIDSLNMMKKRYSLHDDVKLEHILSLKESIEIIEKPVINHSIESELLQILEEATRQLADMRKAEGDQLKLDLLNRLDLMKKLTIELEELAPNVIEQYRERIEKRISEFMQGKVDEQRILTEVAIFAEKADISEEITRIHSHIQQFADTIQIDEPIGRKLDFLVQELNREVNTIGSKANDQLIAKNVVELKSIIEKVKEQVQNIE